MNINRAANLIHFVISITRVCTHCSFIANSKALSIYISIGYFIAIYCRHYLDFIIGYFKTFSNAIFNFDSYGVSICFGSNNSKTFVSSIAWFILMILLLQILKHFLLLLQLLILKLLVTLLLGFISIVRVYVWEPPYTTAPPCNAWGNAPVDDS